MGFHFITPLYQMTGETPTFWLVDLDKKCLRWCFVLSFFLGSWKFEIPINPNFLGNIFFFQWLFLVPLKGGRWHIIHQLAGNSYRLYTTYILPSGGLYATYHLLGEPETTIDFLVDFLDDFASDTCFFVVISGPLWETGVRNLSQKFAGFKFEGFVVFAKLHHVSWSVRFGEQIRYQDTSSWTICCYKGNTLFRWHVNVYDVKCNDKTIV